MDTRMRSSRSIATPRFDGAQAAADLEREAGLGRRISLHGLPIALKDLLHVQAAG